MNKITRRKAAGQMMILAPATAFGTQANSAVSFGIIGTGGRGVFVGGIMTKVPHARLTAICDLFPDRIDKAKTSLPGADKARSYRDYRDLLGQADIDAVLIATPLFLHPEHFEAAVKAGKHVYCEKPAGADVAGVKRLMRAGESADPTKVYQFGFQQRFSPEYLAAERMVKAGRIGPVSIMHSYWILGGSPPRGPFKSPYPPEVQKLRHWASWREYSGSCIVEQDCHGLDVLNWFGGGHPLRARGTGGLRYPLVYGDWTSDHHNIVYDYPNNVEGWLLSIKHAGGYRDVREQLYGPQGMIELARTYYKLHGPIPTSGLRSADNLEDASLIEKVVSRREITIDAAEHFFRSIYEKKPLNMAKDAGEATLGCILGRMAYETKREVSWDEMMRSA